MKESNVREEVRKRSYLGREKKEDLELVRKDPTYDGPEILDKSNVEPLSIDFLEPKPK